MSQNELSSDINDFGLNFVEVGRIFHRQRKLIFFSTVLVFTLGFSYSLAERIFKPLYAGYFTLLVEDPFKKSEEKNTNNFVEDIASYKTSNDLPTIIEVLKSKELISSVLKKYDMDYKSFLRSLAIEKGGNIKNIREEANGIIKVTFFGTNKVEILNILKDMSEKYVSYSLIQRKNRIKEGLDFLNSQNPNIKERISDIQNKIEKVRSQNLFINPNEDLEMLNKLRDRYNIDRNFLITQLEEFTRVREDIKKGKVFATSFKDTIITSKGKLNAEEFGLSLSTANQAILTELETLKKRLAKSKTIYLPDSEIVKSLESKIDILKPLANTAQLQAVETGISSTKLKIDELDKKQNKVLEKYKNILSLIKKFDLLNEELLIAKQNYTAFTQTKEKFRLGIAQNNFPWEIINYPTIGTTPIKPNLINRISLFAFLSIMSGLILSLIKDRYDNFYHSSNEVKEELNLKILSDIPFLKNTIEQKKNYFIDNIFYNSENKIRERNILYKNQIKRNLYLHNEAYKFLISSLKLEKEKENFKIINFTSSIQGEGKSQTIFDFSKKLNSIGLKVLLIDGDLRRPQLHKKFKVENKIGLSDLNNLTERNFQDLIKKDSQYNNIDLITSGSELKDPFKIFNSDNFQEFIIWLKTLDKYEYIIFDSPQSLFLAESNLLSNKVDFTVLIVSLFKVNKELVNETLKNIKIVEGNILGAITVSNRDGDSFGYNYNNNLYGYYNSYFNNSAETTKSGKNNFNRINFFKWFDR